MKASDFREIYSMECRECGKVFTDRLSPDNRMHERHWIPAARQLAGHIMSSRDHRNKRWAKNYLREADVGAKLDYDSPRNQQRHYGRKSNKGMWGKGGW